MTKTCEKCGGIYFGDNCACREKVHRPTGLDWRNLTSGSRDLFNRQHALNYLYNRVIGKPRPVKHEQTKQYPDGFLQVKARKRRHVTKENKAKSSSALPKTYLIHEVEDLAQQAFLHYWENRLIHATIAPANVESYSERWPKGFSPMVPGKLSRTERYYLASHIWTLTSWTQLSDEAQLFERKRWPRNWEPRTAGELTIRERFFLDRYRVTGRACSDVIQLHHVKNIRRKEREQFSMAWDASFRENERLLTAQRFADRLASELGKTNRQKKSIRITLEHTSKQRALAKVAKCHRNTLKTRIDELKEAWLADHEQVYSTVPMAPASPVKPVEGLQPVKVHHSSPLVSDVSSDTSSEHETRPEVETYVVKPTLITYLDDAYRLGLATQVNTLKPTVEVGRPDEETYVKLLDVNPWLLACGPVIG